MLNGLRRLVRTPISAGNTTKVELALLLIGMLSGLLILAFVRCSGDVLQPVEVEDAPR